MTDFNNNDNKEESVRDTLRRVMTERGYFANPVTIHTEIGDFTSYADEDSPLVKKNQAQVNVHNPFEPQAELQVRPQVRPPFSSSYQGTAYNNNSQEVPAQQNGIQQLKMPAGSQQQLTMPSYEVQQQLQETTNRNKLKDWARNTGDAIQAGAVGYTSGATLGNFDEAMGAATAAVTFNPDNYALGRDATRQLQKDLQKRHPYIYGGAEMLGAAQSPMHLVKDTTFANRVLNAATDTMNASIGYSQDFNDFATNLVVNGLANSVGLATEYLPGGRALGVIGRKALTQGANYLTNEVKDELLYNREDEDEEKNY